jgi:hypothetical protein
MDFFYAIYFFIILSMNNFLPGSPVMIKRFSFSSKSKLNTIAIDYFCDESLYEQKYPDTGCR